MPTETKHETARLPTEGRFYVVLKGEAAFFSNGKKLEYDELLERGSDPEGDAGRQLR